jgi:hypothetical protein
MCEAACPPPLRAAAALYYAPVAEKVLDMAQLRESLPQVGGRVAG